MSAKEGEPPVAGELKRGQRTTIQQKMDIARENAQEIKNAYQATFELGVGPDVLQDLEAQFDVPLLVANDPYLTHARVGALEVIKYIREMLKEN